MGNCAVCHSVARERSDCLALQDKCKRGKDKKHRKEGYSSGRHGTPLSRRPSGWAAAVTLLIGEGPVCYADNALVGGIPEFLIGNFTECQRRSSSSRCNGGAPRDPQANGRGACIRSCRNGVRDLIRGKFFLVARPPFGRVLPG